MNEKLVEVLEKAVTWLENRGEFLTEQTPLVIDELLRWEIVSSSVMLSMSAGAVIAIVVIAKEILKKIRPLFTDLTADYVCFYSIAVAVSAFPFYVALASFSRLLFVLVAPRLVVIDKLNELIRGF